MPSSSFEAAEALFLLGQFEEAVQAFEEVVRSDPSDARAWSHLGIAAVHVGRILQAEAALREATELLPRDAEAWFHLGVCRSVQGDWPGAVRHYRRAVALVPSDLAAWHRLGVALSEVGDSHSAEAAFGRALLLSREPHDEALGDPAVPRPREPNVTEPGETATTAEAKSWLDLALSLLSLGDAEAARSAFEKASAIDPDRASRSLFPPMLRLVDAATEAAEGLDEEEEGAPEGPSPDDRAPRLPIVPARLPDLRSDLP